MSVETTNSKLSIIATTGQTRVELTYFFPSDESLRVFVDGVKVESGFVIEGAGSEDPLGAVTFDTPFVGGEIVTITRVVPVVQGQRYALGGRFPSTNTEDALDYLTFIDQQQEEALGRAITLPEGTTVESLEISNVTTDDVGKALIITGTPQNPVIDYATYAIDTVAQMVEGYKDDAEAAALSAASSASAASASASASAASAVTSASEADRAQFIADSIDLPQASTGNAGDVVKVNATATGYELGKIVSYSHAPQSIVKAPLGARPVGWSPAECDAPVVSMTVSGTIVTVQAGVQVAYADSGQVKLSTELVAPIDLDLTAEPDGTKYIYVNLNADGTVANVGITALRPVVGTSMVGQDLMPAFTSATLAGWGTVSASSYAGAGTEPFVAFDRNNGTIGVLTSQWRANAATDQWLDVAFEQTRKLVGVSIGVTNFSATEAANRGPERCDIQVNGVTLKSFSGKTWLQGEVYTVMFDSAVDADSLRLAGMQTNGITTSFVGLADVRPLFARESDLYNPATIAMLDSSDIAIRRVYLGNVVKTGGTIVAVNCYAIGTKYILPVVLSFSPGVKYTLGNPFPTKHGKAQPLLYNAGKFCKTNPPVYIGGWQGAAYEIDETAITVQVLGSYAYCYNKATSTIDGISSGKLAIEIERGF